MKITAPILVATENVEDGQLVRKLLREEFDNVWVSTNADKFAEDFARQRPEVLVLAFDTLEKSERHYLGLYRRCTAAHEVRHRTVILCDADNVRGVYELCKAEYFDDYVLFWPMSQDATRLLLAVHHALRLNAAAASRDPAAEIAAHARRIGDLDEMLDKHAGTGSRCIEAAHRSLEKAGTEIGVALDQFSQRLVEGGDGRAAVEVRDSAVLHHELERLKTEEVGRKLQSVAVAVQPVQEWADSLQQQIAPRLRSVRNLKALAGRVRPLVLVVDDDAVSRKLMARLLSEEGLEPVLAKSGMQALTVIGKRRPDLVLMDLNLGDISGLDVTRRLKSIASFASIPVLMITGQSGKEVVVESLQAGAAGFVVKPFKRETFLAKVRSCLDAPSDQESSRVET